METCPAVGPFWQFGPRADVDVGPYVRDADVNDDLHIRIMGVTNASVNFRPYGRGIRML